MNANSHFTLSEPQAFSFDIPIEQESIHVDVSSEKAGRNWKIQVNITNMGEQNYSETIFLNPLQSDFLLGFINPEYERDSTKVLDMTKIYKQTSDNQDRIKTLRNEVLFRASQKGKFLLVDIAVKTKT